MDIVIYLVLIALGLFFIATGVFHWDTLFFDGDARIIGYLGGETAARWYWVICGVALVGAVATHWIFGWWPWWF